MKKNNESIILYGKRIPYDGKPLCILVNSLGKSYDMDLKALEQKQGEISKAELVKTFDKLLKLERKVVNEAEAMDSVRAIVTVGGLTEQIKKAKKTIEFLEKVLLLLRE
ncbi:MAG: hypothetical protein WC595_06655 [Candidatus Nanoarchaeia archaeon]